MRTLNQFLYIQAATRLQMLNWKDSPLINLSSDEQHNLLKELKIILVLSDVYTYRKEKVYVRELWGCKKVFSDFLERERHRIVGKGIKYYIKCYGYTP